MNSAGFNSTGLGSFIKGKSAFPAAPVTIREGSIIPGNKGEKFSIKHHQFGIQQRGVTERSSGHNILVSSNEWGETKKKFVSG